MKPASWWKLKYLHWLDRRNCFHHNHKTGESWIETEIIDWRKLYTCRDCGRRWVI